MHALAGLAGELDPDILEPGAVERLLVLADRERAGDAAAVGASLGALLGSEPVLGDDVADRDATAGRQHAGELANTAGLSVDRLITQLEIATSTLSAGSGTVLDDALEEVRVREIGGGDVLARQRQHLGGHVEPPDDPGRPDLLGGPDHIRPAPEPRSSTRSPERRSAAASGSPEPRLITPVVEPKPQQLPLRVAAAA